MNQEITSYIQNIGVTWQVEICNQIRQLIHQEIGEIEEQIKYKQAFYSLKDKQVCVFFPAKNWINITLFHAENLEGPPGFFEKSAKPERKSIKIKQDTDFIYDLLAKHLKQIAQNITIT
ncbi:DUF1801 domain-containing protein [Shimazuella kribbensis]|uniref:DUF1801 domain-containing protein n=1 Tax=Shimazuella kribbensis TaxID=139808 RepID=UPI000409175F|nr:DUF1801 domain-containing protein [Shimazuella kribbensis]